MKYLYFKQDGTLWIKGKSPAADLEAEYPNPIAVEDDYDTMIEDTSITVEVGMPTARREKTRTEIVSELSYATKRKAEYPSIGDQLDALWKGGDAADEMIAKVQAVKNKYPKP
jgi:hypothetical protein